MLNSVILHRVADSLFETSATGESGYVPLSTFVSNLEEQRREQDPLFTWMAGAQLPVDVLGPVGDVISGAPTLGHALRQLEQGFPLLQSDTSLTMQVRDDEVYLGYRILDPDIWPRRADAEFTLSLFHSICLRYGMPRGALRRAGFEGPEDRAAGAAALHLANKPVFEQNENYLVFPARFLSFTGPAETVIETFPERCRSLRGQILAHRKERPLSDLVRECLLRQMGTGHLNQAAVAEELGLSERSLRRRLALENSSFHAQLEECRRAHAVQLLTRSTQSLAAIAEQLGYSDQTAFSRACSRWYGMGPSRLRSEPSARLH